MINLQLDPVQDFSTRTIQLPYSEWSFSPDSPKTIISIVGNADPSNFPITTQIKNYINELGLATYDAFYVKQELSFSINSAATQWVAITGEIPSAPIEGYLLSQANLDVTTTINFQNISQLSTGDYSLHIRHIVYGKLPSGTFVEIDVVVYTIILKRLGYYELSLQPFITEFTHYIGGALPPSQTLSIFANGAFNIKVFEHISLSAGNLVLDSTVDSWKIYSGNNPQDVQVSLDISIESIGETVPDFHLIPIELYNDQGNNSQSLVKVFQYATADYLVTPLSLEFIAVQNVVEAASQEVTIQGFGSWTATKPSWLTITPALGDNNNVMQVKPIPSLNLVPGTYQGNISTTTTSGVFNVAVKHTVVGSIDTGFNPKLINFTRDRATISNFYGEDSSTINLALDVVAFNYGLLLTKQILSNYKKGLFNNTTNFFLGKIVEQIMFNLFSLNSIQLDYLPQITTLLTTPQVLGGTVYKYYNPSLTQLAASFIDRDTGVEIGTTQNFINIAFIAGRRPTRFIDQYGILDFKESPIRVTKNSTTILNLYRSVGSNKVEILKNNVVVGVFYPENGNNQIFGMRLDFSTFLPGDVIDAKVYFSSANNVKYYTQRYLMFDEGLYSYHIGWENEHRVLELYEFTGVYSFNNNTDEVVATNFNNYLANLQKYEGDKELKFVANTGFILKSNQERIDSLLNASRAWVIFKEDRAPIALVPRVKKFIPSDSELEMYQYQVEFTINPTHELENNTF